jgi:hypothetical protein
VTNYLCQFDPGSAVFDRKSGVRLFAMLPEPNGTYRLDIKLPAGEQLRTFTGSTTNGLIEVHWDLKDDHGRLCTNNAYDTYSRDASNLPPRADTAGPVNAARPNFCLALTPPAR